MSRQGRRHTSRIAHPAHPPNHLYDATQAPGPNIGRPRALHVLLASVGVAAITVVGVSLPNHWGLFDVQPHPLWVPVVAIAVLYGSPSGYVAGFLAAFVYVGLLWLRAGGAIHELALSQLVQPALFPLVGALIGRVVTARRKRLVEAERQYCQVLDLWRSFYERHTATLKAKAQLEKRLITLCGSMTTLCESAARGDAPRTEDVWPSTAVALGALLDTKKVQIYDATDPAALENVPGSVRRPLLGTDGRLLGAVFIEDGQLTGLSKSAVTCFEQVVRCSSLALHNTCVGERTPSGVEVQLGGASDTN